MLLLVNLYGTVPVDRHKAILPGSHRGHQVPLPCSHIDTRGECCRPKPDAMTSSVVSQTLSTVTSHLKDIVSSVIVAGVTDVL